MTYVTKDDDISSSSELSDRADRLPDTRRIDTNIAALSPRTRQEYRRDLQRFLDWGSALPASSETVADYLAGHATAHAAATLARWLVSISRAHMSQGLPDPTKSELVKATLRDIRRAHARVQRQVTPTLGDDPVAMVRELGERPKEMRDPPCC